MAPWVVGAYFAGVVVMLSRLASSLLRAERLRQCAERIPDGPFVQSLQRLSKKWSIRVVPVLAQCDEIVVPRVVGLVKQTILLPVSALSGLSSSELEMILAHEFAHVRRHDMWVNLLQRLAEAALFFNPALWYLSRKIGTLREHCCDEQACRSILPSGMEPRLRYATALLRIVELTTTNADDHFTATALAASGRTPSELRRAWRGYSANRYTNRCEFRGAVSQRSLSRCYWSRAAQQFGR